MYAWIWRHLPYGLPGKVIGSLLLAAGAVSLLWFLVFPATSEWVERVLLPFDESTIGNDDPAPLIDPTGTAPQPSPTLVGPDGEPLGEHDIPYETDE
jgi:hypothetical protein